MRDATAEPDGDRMRRWAAGDRAAFAEIVRAWEGPVGRFAYRLTFDAHAAADITQEVFLRLFRAGAKYQDAGRFKTWLYQIALNLCRDAARSKARKPSVPLTVDIDPAGDSDGDEDDHGETAEVVTAAVAALPDHLREVVVLRHYEDMSFEAMGRMLGVPATTLKSRFGMAMKELEAVLVAKFT